ncbi:MAG: hypothetical protein KJN98_07880 [Pontiella sp.]|nr:hypothetical protein [Pontiella sp.]
MTHLREIILELSNAGVEFVIGGGVACVLQGVERFTLDLDIAVNLASENLEKFIAVMESQGLIPRVPVAPRSLLEPEVRRMIVEEKNALVFTFMDPRDPRRHVDMFLRDDLSYETLNAASERILLNGLAVKVVGKRKLLEIKEAIDPPRDKDQLDISALRRILGDG